MAILSNSTAPPGPLELARRSRGFTQTELAAASGLSPSLISMAERGYLPGVRARTAIAEALELRVEDLWPAVTT